MLTHSNIMEPSARRTASGFSLIELAIVLMIVGALTSGVLVAVSRTMERTRITTAQAQLLEIREALYGFAQANGRLPCPATVSSDGKEDPVGGAPAGGACTNEHGFVPIATLGFSGAVNSDGLLLDAWQNPVRYSVAPYAYSGGTATFTNKAALDTLFSTDTAMVSGTGFVDHANMLRICDNAACTLNILADSVPAVIFSMGANWTSYSSTDEQQNAGSLTVTGPDSGNVYPINDQNTFVSRTYSEENFDDQILWLSPYTLFDRLIDAGRLP